VSGPSVLSSLHSAITGGLVELVDLTAPLSPRTPVLQLPPPFANTIGLRLETVSDFDDLGPMWKWHNIHTGEHTGTHVDAPAHWVTGRDGWTIDQVPPERLVGPAIVVDVSTEAAVDPDFLLEPEHLEEWESEHGRIPDGAWVLLRTGWSARGGSQEEFLNADEHGPHTPGPSVAAARWLAAERAITGFGVETVGIDAGSAGGMDPAFPAHYFLLGAGKLGLTQLQQLDRLPTTGALLVVQPLRLVGGTGSPARVLALVEQS
jgi:kynurenine formamidase